VRRSRGKELRGEGEDFVVMKVVHIRLVAEKGMDLKCI
jgi:hypothetical protein